MHKIIDRECSDDRLCPLARSPCTSSGCPVPSGQRWPVPSHCLRTPTQLNPRVPPLDQGEDCELPRSGRSLCHRTGTDQNSSSSCLRWPGSIRSASTAVAAAIAVTTRTVTARITAAFTTRRITSPVADKGEAGEVAAGLALDMRPLLHLSGA